MRAGFGSFLFSARIVSVAFICRPLSINGQRAACVTRATAGRAPRNRLHCVGPCGGSLEKPTCVGKKNEIKPGEDRSQPSFSRSLRLPHRRLLRAVPVQQMRNQWGGEWRRRNFSLCLSLTGFITIFYTIRFCFAVAALSAGIRFGPRH